ncbi:MAG: NAD-glutamate dehydrogenase [Acidimicrobiales bacterium]
MSGDPVTGDQTSSEAVQASGTVIDRVVRYALATVPDRPELDSALRNYYAHIDPGDLDARPIEDLFGLAVDHFRMVDTWQPGTIAIEVADPRIEVDGWGSGNTVVRIVTDDMPFLVDSVTMELSRLGVGIRFVAHPVLSCATDGPPAFGASDALGADRQLLSLISIEIDRRMLAEDQAEIEPNLRRVLGDVRAAVDDWQAMQDRMVEVSASIKVADLPLDERDVNETAELLDWLAADHFLFLGARDYELGHDGEVEVLRIVPGSGLGILQDEQHLGGPRPLSEMSTAAREQIRERRLLNLTKAGTKATVHRASHLDYVGIKTFDEAGEVSGERRFLGLFASEVYNRSVAGIPRARRTMAEVLKKAGFPSGGHDEKRLMTVLERYPRDDLLQMEADELYDTAVAIAGLQERRRVRVFSRRELFGRFVTVLVYLPRDRYNTATRSSIEQLLLGTYRATLADWDAQMSESVLARLRYVLRVDSVEANGTTARVHGLGEQAIDAELETQIESLIRLWDDDFAAALGHRFGEDEALVLQSRYSDAFDLDFQRAFDPRAAAVDVGHLESLVEDGALRLSAYREPGRESTSFKLKLYRRGDRVSLTTVMPILTNLGVTVVDERPYEVQRAGHDPLWIYDFALEHDGSELEFADAAVLVEEAFAGVWNGTFDDDGLNRLVLRAGLGAADVAVLRAYSRYLHQVRFAYSPSFVEQALAEHPAVVRLMFELFTTRFDPDEAEGDGETVGAAAAELEDRIAIAIDTIESLDHDRVLRRFLNLITATIRTTWAQRDQHGNAREYLALKFDCRIIEELPEPRPAYEIFVYSPRFEGVHLRAGPVARGGLRWSDRSEDYRTEVLGLVKAQMVKNAVIVPAGAKGGFVLKRRPDDVALLSQEVVACYQLFISGLLELTDNFVDGQAVAPQRTRRYDGDDPYLVVAADKGTATFSDVANTLALDRGFWLGDAFASGGSQGYDHKRMGITARGAWESVKRHFRELGLDVESDPVSAVGIGDMSGDVFGNGMLLSRSLGLVAAFDHRHIFIDPEPDAELAYEERRRLFELPRSSWDDYDRSLISAGGGIYDRTAKSIDLSEQACRALGVESDSLTPEELISACLRAPVGLLWNGGIGTYVKASGESNAEVGDKANDHIRVSAIDLRCSVIGEGGNLGVTQRGRVEFAKNGGRVYTDAIDNAGGVDCSDHEVNIKILLDEIVADEDMTAKQRNSLLEEMTNDVAMLVLANNYRQSLALSVARIDATSLVDVHARYMDELEQHGELARELEALPDGEDLSERRLAGTGLTTPELAVLSAYTKNMLGRQIIESSVPDDEAMLPLLVDYFPVQLRQRFGPGIAAHRLRREIIANQLANLVVDRAGVSMVYRLGQETSAPAAEIASAHFAAWSIFDLESVVTAVNSLDGVLSVDKQLAVHLGCRQLAERATRLMLRNRPIPFNAALAIAELAGPVSETTAGLADDLLGTDRQSFEAEVADLSAGGAPMELAVRAAGLSTAVAALDIVAVAADAGLGLREVAAAHFAAADGLDLTWLRDRILALPRDTQWSTLARLTLRTDLYADHRELTAQIMAVGEDDLDPQAKVEQWLAINRPEVDRYRKTMVAIRATTTDLTSLLVAAREVRNLISRTRVTAD